MNQLIFLLTFFAFFSAVHAEKFVPYRAYLSNIEEDDSTVTVFKDPKFNLHNCTKPSCKEIAGTLNRFTKIMITGPEISVKTIDSFSGEEVLEDFVPIHFLNHDGFIEKSLLTNKKYSAFYNITKELKSRSPANFHDTHSKISKPDVVATASEIFKYVGECVVSPANAPPNNLPTENIFDQLILTKLKKQKVPALMSENNTPMTQEDLINIDALARTIYGEMGKCFRKGLQYPIAAALVAVNRAENKPRFKEWTSTKVKRTGKQLPQLTQILTTPEKFNNWKAYNNGKNNGPLHHSLCPPKVVNQPFWKETKASQDQVDVWKNAVRIATEAVLFRKKFKARAPAMQNINFYTSGMGEYNGYTQVFPYVNGRPLDNEACIETWKEPTKK